MPEDWLRERVFALCYRVHGGSGLNFRPEDVKDMELADVEWYMARLSKQREAEADAMRKAQKSR